MNDETKTPTLDELLDRIQKMLDDPSVKKYRESFELYFRSVATGRDRVLRDNNAMFAAQCVIVLIEHVEKNTKNNQGDG